MLQLILKTLLITFLLLSFQAASFAEGPECGSTHLNDSDFEAIKNANALVYKERGDSNQASPDWLVFEKFLKFGKLASDHIDRLLKEASPAGKLYAAILLKQLDRNKADQALASMESSKEAVFYFKGCAKSQTSLGELAKRIIKGEELVFIPDEFKQQKQKKSSSQKEKKLEPGFDTGFETGSKS